MPKTIVKSKINKTALEEFSTLLKHLRTNVFPYMSDEEIQKLAMYLKNWCEEMYI